LLEELFSNSSTDQQKLKIVEALAKQGIRSLHVKDNHGKSITLRFELEHIGSRMMVHMFSQAADGHEKTLLRGISGAHGYVHERDKNGNEVSFATADAKFLGLLSPKSLNGANSYQLEKSSKENISERVSSLQPISYNAGSPMLDGVALVAKSKATAYYPANNAMEGGKVDKAGKPLHTLEQYLAGQAPYVSIAMGSDAGFKYGQKLQIEELNKKYNRQIECRIVDTGGAFEGKGTSRVDICMANEASANDFGRRDVTLIVPSAKNI
jgi:3D (Asp-Asp-Asp) domain-containing protein